MAGLRGSKQLWGTGQTGAIVSSFGTTGATGDISDRATVGAQQNVCIYVGNTGGTAATFNVEVATSGVSAPGENALNDIGPDEGMIWFKYDRGTGITAPTGTFKAVDLSPFGPQYLRLRRTDSNGATSIVAFVTSEAP